MANDMLTLSLDGEVSLDDFAIALKHFRALVTRLSSEVGGRGSIRWVIDDLQAGSATATIRGESRNAEKIERVVQAYGVVGRSLERSEGIPYSEKVSKPAEAIVKLLNGHIRSVRFETPEDDATVYSRAQDRPDVEHGPRSAFGAVKGRIQTLSNRRGLRFVLFDSLHDRAVSCYLSESDEDKVRDAWGRRAIVQGMVSRDPLSGRPVAIRQITRIQTLEEPEPRSYIQARGVIPRQPNDLLPEDLIRRMRDAS